MGAPFKDPQFHLLPTSICYLYLHLSFRQLNHITTYHINISYTFTSFITCLVRCSIHFNFCLLSLLTSILQTTQPKTKRKKKKENKRNKKGKEERENKKSLQRFQATTQQTLQFNLTIHFNQPSGQSFNQHVNQHFNQQSNHPINQPSNHPISRSSIQTTLQSTIQSINHPFKQHFNQPSNHPINESSIQTTLQSTSDRGGLHSFRTIGRLVTTTSNTPLYQPRRSPPTINNIHQSDRGGLRLQDNRQAGDNHFDYPLNHSPRTTTSTSLTVAGFGFRTIGRLVTTTLINPSINHVDQPARSITSTSLTVAGFQLQDNRQTGDNHFDRLTVAGFGFRTIGRLITVEQSPMLACMFATD
ncbi:hypothetical protein VN97_g7036 [Penicillium thymicola]|uniref:Uncharacterized protein n=1 Tax=Penicillium thymicola TaxID=293382 RepID=A0AAI9X770_PENTH|nr:hypothetical protein VN97_g7036 [Penicillium thymicola]